MKHHQIIKISRGDERGVAYRNIVAAKNQQLSIWRKTAWRKRNSSRHHQTISARRSSRRVKRVRGSNNA